MFMGLYLDLQSSNFRTKESIRTNKDCTLVYSGPGSHTEAS